MLPGNAPGVMGENVRTAKNQGMNERDAVMAAMGQAKPMPASDEEGSEITCPSCGATMRLQVSPEPTAEETQE